MERERSGHARGPGAHFAGVRTFTLMGGLAGTVGWLWTGNLQLPAVVLLLGATALVVAAYAAASRNNVDGTTEVAALIVLAAGVLAGTNHLGLASGVIAVTTLPLVEKSRLHALVASIDDAGLRAGFRFAVMAVVILPLLPEGPYGPLGGIRPRQLWTLVLFFSGLSFGGYIIRFFVGSRRGYPIAGVIRFGTSDGGAVSSGAFRRPRRAGHMGAGWRVGLGSGAGFHGRRRSDHFDGQECPQPGGSQHRGGGHRHRNTVEYRSETSPGISYWA